MQYVTRPGDMLDALCSKRYPEHPGATEAVLDANPGLARRGPILPEGLTIDLPDLPPPPSGQVSLWD